MGQVLLDSKYYTVKDGTIQRRNINPRAVRFDTGLPGYASFTEGSAKAYKGLRGGIGHKYDTGEGTEECYWSESLDATHHGGIIQGPKINTAGTGAGAFGVAPVKIIDFDSGTYAIGNSQISKWNTTDSDWDSVDTSLASPIDAIVVTDDTDTYLVVSSATAAIKSTTGASGSWTTLTGYMGYLTYFDNRLCGWAGNTIYYSPARDIDGTVSTCTVGGVYLGTIHGLFTARSQENDEPLLCINTSEGLFTFDFWVQQAYPYLRLTGHTYAGKAAMFWNSYIWCSTGAGIKKIAGKIVTDVGTDQEDGLPKTYQGLVYDMCPAGDGSWMVFCVNGGTANKSSIFKRHGTVGGNQQIYTTSAVDNAIACVHYSPSHMTTYTNGRLWWGEGTDVKYCMMPDYNADVTEIDSYEFVLASGRLIYPIFRPLEAFPKTVMAVAGATAACDDNKKFTIEYRTNANTLTAVGSNWTELGTFTTSPNPTALLFGDDDEGEEVYAIQLAVTGATNSATTTPVLRSLELDYDIGTKRLRGWTFNVKVARHNSKTIVNNLHTSQEKNTLLKFYPSGDSTHGDSYHVKIDNIAENIEWGMLRIMGTLQVTVKELIRR